VETSLRKLNTGARWKWLFVGFASLFFFVWLANTPAGLLGKADAVGYAVCHRIDARSFHLDERPIPLCARCSGMYLGALLGIGFQLSRGKPSRMPPLPIGLFFGLLALGFAFDGVNSYVQFFPEVEGLYQPHNYLRLLTGTGMGLAISAILVPAFNQTVWEDWDQQAGIGTWKQVASLVGLAIILDGFIILENPLILYPLAILSAMGVLIVLGAVYTLIWLMVFRKENQYKNYRQLWLPLMAGLMTALLQVATIDLVRYWLTGTWDGFQF
jgi:uncharacterized membrane protein